MPTFGPTKRKDVIAALRRLGFTGPIAGGKHAYMERNGQKVRIPNPHQSDIDIGLLRRILDEADISRQEWEQV